MKLSESRSEDHQRARRAVAGPLRYTLPVELVSTMMRLRYFLFAFLTLALAGGLLGQSQTLEKQQGQATHEEIVFWESVRDSRDPSDFRAYLAKYPNGTFSELAKNRLTRLTEASRDKVTPAPSENDRLVWTDPTTNLMWTIEANAASRDFNGTVSYCRSLRLADYSDWRVPELNELGPLYNSAGNRIREPFRFKLGTAMVWSATPWGAMKNGSRAGWGYSFNHHGLITGPVPLEITIPLDATLCVRNAANTTNGAQTGAAGSDTGETDIRREIDAIARSGQYSPLPEAQTSMAKDRSATTATRIVRNDTAYALHVLMSGPVDREVDLLPGGSTSIAMPPGSYRVAARVDSANVLPFYGVQSLQGGMEYTSLFYLK